MTARTGSPKAKRPSALRRLLGELTRSFALMPWVAAVLALVAGLPELAIAIVAVILLNAAFATVHDLASASGAAFITVVFAQAANAFACRSSSRWPGSLGWGSNHLLLGAVAVGIAFSLATLCVTPVAELLGQASPPWRSDGTFDPEHGARSVFGAWRRVGP